MSTSPFNQLIDQQLNQMAKRIVPFRTWIWLFILVGLIIGIILWAIMGTVQVTIQGRGIILNQHGLFTIQTDLNGILKTVFVQPGDEVKQGDLVAEIYNADQEILFLTTQTKIKALTEELHQLHHRIQIEEEAAQLSMQKELASLEFDVKILNEKLTFLEHEYKKRENLYKKGLIILNLVQDTGRQIDETKIALEEKQGAIANVRVNLKKPYRVEELKNKELALLKAKEEAEVTQTTLNQTQVYSSFDGRILEILVNPGEVMKTGQELIKAEALSLPEQLIFYGYFPAELGKYIHLDSTMTLALANVNEKEYGTLIGHVKNISQYAISEPAMRNLLHNTNLVHFLSNNRPVTQVIAFPVLNPQDPTGYQWTSDQGPPIKISTGTVGEAKIVVESMHPIYYLLPLQKFKKTSL